MQMWVTGKRARQQTPSRGYLSPLKRSRHDPAAGFTLVELMVVLVIIGLAASVVVLTLPPSEKSLQDETEVIAARLRLANEEAIVTGSVIGLYLDLDGYQFLRQREGRWESFSPAGLQGHQPWPNDVRPTIRYEGERLPLSYGSTRKNSLLPSIYFLPTGESANVQIRFEDGGKQATIQISDIGNISIETDGV